MKIQNAVFFAGVLLSNSVQASICEHQPIIPANTMFAGIYEKSTLIAQKLCLIEIGESVPDSEMRTLADAWKARAIQETRIFESVGLNFQDQISVMHSEFLDGAPYAQFNTTKEPMTYSVNGDTISVIENSEVCRTVAGTDCYEVLEQLEDALNSTKFRADVIQREKVYQQIGLYDSQWTKYFTDARSQTSWELAANTWLYKDELQKDHFVSPPEYQLILLHPNIVLESVPDAKDGDQLKEALALELIGFNRWNASTPYGASITAVYSDRADVDDLGVGLMFHVNNSYSFGVTKRDDETGYFISIDLLKFFESKQQNLRAMKEQVDKIRAMHN